MLRNVVTAAIVGATIALASCGTVKGAANDVSSVADCTEDLMKQGKC